MKGLILALAISNLGCTGSSTPSTRTISPVQHIAPPPSKHASSMRPQVIDDAGGMLASEPSKPGRAGSPILTAEQISSVISLLATKKTHLLSELEVVLGKKFSSRLVFIPVSYASFWNADNSYTQVVYTWGMSKDRDLLIVTYNDNGQEVVHSWFVRDLPSKVIIKASQHKAHAPVKFSDRVD